MRVNQAILTAAVAMLVGWGMGASDTPVRIGVVDLDQAVSSTEQGKKARGEFERKQREAEGKLQPLHDRLKELMKEFEAKRFVLSDDALFQKQLDLAELRNQIENMRREIQGQLEVDRERLVGPLRSRLAEIVEELGRTKGFSLILNRKAPGLMYSREALDVTDLVIEKFDKKG